jgi:hypothetical protein
VIGRAARQARRAPAPPPGHPGLARRVLALVAARGRAVPGQPQLLPPCLSPASCASCG